MEDQTPIIVRFSGCSEGLKERGKFYSSKGTLKKMLQPLREFLQNFVADKDLVKEKIPLIIQKYALPISAKGHLSNERRFCKENRDWLGEFEEIKTGKPIPFQTNLRNWRRRINVDKLMDEPLACNLKAHVSEVLKIPSAWGYEHGLRFHFEWVWDGKTIYLVQVDQEHEVAGIDPTTVCKLQRKLPSKFVPKCLKEIDENQASRYYKIRNVFTYLKLGLPITKLYALDDQFVINDLALGKVSLSLEEDLS